MTSLDLGLFGLDCFVADKTSSLEQDMDIYSATEFENLLNDTSGQNILDLSLQQSGITQDTAPLQDNITVRLQSGQGYNKKLKLSVFAFDLSHFLFYLPKGQDQAFKSLITQN